MNMRRALLSILVFTSFALSQQTTIPPPASDIIDRVTPSVAMLFIGSTPAKVDAIGSAVVIRESGVLLTAYHVVKDAKAVQVRFKNGEIFDDVQLLGIDPRRDIAAIHISASNLPTLTVSKGASAKSGDAVYVISHPEALPWSASSGIVSAYRMADEVPGAGTGFRLLQFTAPASPGSSGGVLVNAKGELIGLVIGGIDQAQNLNFAVPIENVLGLADVASSRTFASGAALEMPKQAAPAPVESTATTLSIPKQEKTEVKTTPADEDLNKSEVLKSKDPDFILRNFRTLYVDAEKAVYFKSNQMKAALGATPEFTAYHIAIVDDRYVADAVLEVGYTFAWDYPFQLKHQNTSIILLAGKGTGAFSGPAGAGSVAKTLARLLKPYRTPPPEPKKTKK